MCVLKEAYHKLNKNIICNYRAIQRRNQRAAFGRFLSKIKKNDDELIGS